MKRVVIWCAVLTALVVIGACDMNGEPELVVRGAVSAGGAVEPLEGGETIYFGTVGPDGETQDMTFTIQNIGNATLQLIDTDGAYVQMETDSSDGLFTVPVQPTSDTVDPDDSFPFTLRFTSDGSNMTYTGTIEIRSDDPHNPSFELDLEAESSATAP